MSAHALPLLASLANDASRTRFAELVLAGEAGLPTAPKSDRLLIQAGCVKETPRAINRSCRYCR